MNEKEMILKKLVKIKVQIDNAINELSEEIQKEKEIKFKPKQLKF